MAHLWQQERGNQNFKSSVNQNPKEATKGKKGQTGDIDIELKLIADAGLIGFPNAGKSSLLNELTRAKSKIGAYAFTTLDPNLGSFYGYILADIPGLIKGASSGKGLGHKFLKHVERTKLLIHLVSADQDNVAEAYKTIRGELAAFDEGLASKQELVVLSRTDLVPDQEELSSKIKELEIVSGARVLPLSVLDSTSVKTFSDELSKVLGE
jgi:GTP-binding protein